jgi:hypothetical protein
MAMAAFHLHYSSDDGTTYKCALEISHIPRDAFVSQYSGLFTLSYALSNWVFLNLQLRMAPCESRAISLQT